MTNIQNIVSELIEKEIISNLNWLSNDKILLIKNQTLKLIKKSTKFKTDFNFYE